MKLDKQSLDRLANLNDEQMKIVIRKLSHNAGLDLKDINISPEVLAAIRTALSSAGDNDIALLSERLEAFKKQKKM